MKPQQLVGDPSGKAKSAQWADQPFIGTTQQHDPMLGDFKIVYRDVNDPMGSAYSKCREVLLGLNGKERLALLKALGGEFGHRVLPGLGTAIPAQGVPKVGERPQAPRQSRSTKSAEQKEIDSKIKAQNALIKAKSQKLGAPLEGKDPLLVERDRLFCAKRGIPVKPDAPESGAGSSHT
jgi:hypothetical protein